MARERRCSECGASLSGRSALAKTCSDKCRAARTRRIRRAQREGNSLPDELKAVSEIVRSEQPDIVHDLVESELRPIVREAITEDVMRSINEMVALTPTAIAAIKEDLNSEDRHLRNKAYTLLVKYTVGNRAIVGDKEDDDAKNITVNFSMPRPGETDEVPLPAEAEEVKPCDSCGTDKPLSEFVAGSDRCQVCFDEAKAYAMKVVGGEDAD